MSLLTEVENYLSGNNTTTQSTTNSIVQTQPTAPIVQQRMGSLGLQLLEYFEGVRLTAYQDSTGIWTVGYGHTGNVTPKETITFAQAVAYLVSDLNTAETFVSKHVLVPLLQYQFDALVSFTYNVGVGNFLHSSVLADVNASNFAKVPSDLNLWNKAGGSVVLGLIRRRQAEGILFSQGIFNLGSAIPVPDDKQG